MEVNDEEDFDLKAMKFIQQWDHLHKFKEKCVEGTNLLNTIAMAVGYEMIEPITNVDFELANKGKYFMFSDTAKKHADRIAAKMTSSLSEVRLSLIPVALHYKKKLVRLTVFKVVRADNTVFYVDGEARTYRDYNDWLSNNILPPGKIAFPANFEMGDNMQMCRLISAQATWKVKIWRYMDRVATGIGLVSFVVGMLVPGAQVILLGITFAIGTYGMLRSSTQLYDRHSHGQSISLRDQDARRLWINMLASFGTIAMAGTKIGVCQSAKCGTEFEIVDRIFINGALGLNLVGNGLAVLNDGVYLYSNWNDPKFTKKYKFLVFAQMAFSFGCCFLFETADQLIDRARAEAVDQVVRQLPVADRDKVMALRNVKGDLAILKDVSYKVQNMGMYPKDALKVIIDSSPELIGSADIIIGPAPPSRLTSVLKTCVDATIEVGVRKLKESLTSDILANITHIIDKFPDFVLSYVVEVTETILKTYDISIGQFVVTTSILGLIANIGSVEETTTVNREDRQTINRSQDSNVLSNEDKVRWMRILEKFNEQTAAEVYETIKNFRSVKGMVGSLFCDEGLHDEVIKMSIETSKIRYGCEAAAIYQYITEGFLNGENDIKNHMRAANSFICRKNFYRIEKEGDHRYFYYKRQEPYGFAIVCELRGYLTLCTFQTKPSIV